MQKLKLLNSLNRLLEGNVIEDIRFRTDGTPWPEVSKVSDGPTSQELDAVLLSPQEFEVLRLAIESLETISITNTRQALSRRITSEAKLRHWRLEHGWRVCIRCAAVYNTAGAVCPICRLTP
jgi:hypothetical protein